MTWDFSQLLARDHLIQSYYVSSSVADRTSVGRSLTFTIPDTSAAAARMR